MVYFFFYWPSRIRSLRLIGVRKMDGCQQRRDAFRLFSDAEPHATSLPANVSEIAVRNVNAAKLDGPKGIGGHGYLSENALASGVMRWYIGAWLPAEAALSG